MKTWVKEFIIMSIILILALLKFSDSLLNCLTTLAVLISLNLVQISDRLQERQGQMEVADVHCYWKVNYLLVAKEILWITVFLITKNYAGVIGSVMFALYPYWRKYYRKNIKPL